MTFLEFKIQSSKFKVELNLRRTSNSSQVFFREFSEIKEFRELKEFKDFPIIPIILIIPIIP